MSTTSKSKARRRSLYLLHIEQADGSLMHYVGICNEGREHTRFKEHQRDTRRSLLHQALFTATFARETIIDSDADETLERSLQANPALIGHLGLCEHCKK